MWAVRKCSLMAAPLAIAVALFALGPTDATAAIQAAWLLDQSNTLVDWVPYGKVVITMQNPDPDTHEGTIFDFKFDAFTTPYISIEPNNFGFRSVGFNSNKGKLLYNNNGKANGFDPDFALTMPAGATWKLETFAGMDGFGKFLITEQASGASFDPLEFTLTMKPGFTATIDNFAIPTSEWIGGTLPAQGDSRFVGHVAGFTVSGTATSHYIGGLGSVDPNFEPTVIPEPASLLIWGLAGLSLAGAAAFRRRRKEE